MNMELESQNISAFAAYAGKGSKSQSSSEEKQIAEDVKLLKRLKSNMSGSDSRTITSSFHRDAASPNKADTVLERTGGKKRISNGDHAPGAKEASKVKYSRNQGDGGEVFGSKAKVKKEIGMRKKRKLVDHGNSNGIFTKEPKAKLGMERKVKEKFEGSVEKGLQLFKWMISPMGSDEFFAQSWEKRPIHIKRGKPGYYKHLFSTKSFDGLLRGDTPVVYGKNLDVTSYGKAGRETHNPVGRAYAPVVWDYFGNGCSLRLLNPQTFHVPVWELCATLQEYLGSMVGANVYLTPPGTQGFAPHYDDVEVFILQLEGKKHWRLYEPLTPQTQLPRFSSKNFAQEEIGDPCLETTLEPGDMLYMPRGTIHQGNCLEDTHSLHITVSCYQLNSFADLLEKIVPAALATAIEENIEFRRGLPIKYLRHLGVANSDGNTPTRKDFMKRVQRLMGSLFAYAPVDAAVDQLGKRFMRDSLPPYLTPEESARCVEDGGERWHAGKARVINRVELNPDTQIRLIRAHCLRLVTEDDNSVRIYYNVDNTREYQELDEQYLEIEADIAPAVEALISHYPKYLTIQDLPINMLDLKMSVTQNLWEKKLLLTRQILEAQYDD